MSKRKAENSLSNNSKKKRKIFSESESDSDSESLNIENIKNEEFAKDETLAKLTAEEIREKKKKIRARENREDISLSESISGDDDFLLAGEVDPEEELVREELESGAVPLEPFNMDTELRRHEITADGNWKTRVERPEDASQSEDDEYWLTEYDERVGEDEKYREVKKQSEIMSLFEGEDDSKDNVISNCQIIADFLNWGENVNRGLKRLKSDRDGKHNMTFDQLTDLTNRLLNNGVYDIYSYTKEQLLEYIQKETGVISEPKEPTEANAAESTEPETSGQMDYYQQYYQQYYQNVQSTPETSDKPLY